MVVSSAIVTREQAMGADLNYITEEWEEELCMRKGLR